MHSKALAVMSVMHSPIIPAISGKIPTQAIEALKKNPRVAEVELDLRCKHLNIRQEIELLEMAGGCERI